MKKITALFLSLAIITSLSACGEKKEETASTTEATTVITTITEATTEKITTEAPTEPPILDYTEDIYSVYAYLKENCKDVGQYIEYNEKNDPNKVLGTTGEYTQKINFSVLSISEDISYYPGLGACIQIYKDSKAAETKKKAYQSSKEYSTYVSGNIMLRITSSVEASVVSEMQKTLDDFVKSPQSYISQKENLKEKELHPFNDWDTYKSACKPCEFEEIARDSEALVGQRVTFTGEIIQVLDGEYRMNVTQNDYGFYEDTIYFIYDIGDGDRLLEGDIVTIWGNSLGFVSYTALLGQEVTLPAIEARRVELNN